MQIQDVIRRFDDLRSNRLTPEEKGRIVASLDRRINLSVLIPCGCAVTLPADDDDPAEVQERRVLAGDGYEEIYLYMLGAQCSLFEGDIGRYNTEIAEYMRLLREYQAAMERRAARNSAKFAV